MPKKLRIVLDRDAVRVGEPFTARAEYTDGGVPRGTVRFGFDNPDALTYESTGKARVRITPTLAGPLVIDATETRNGPDATGTVTVTVQPAVVPPPVEPPPPPPVVEPPPPITPTPGVPADLVALLGGPVAPVSAAASLPEPLRAAVAAYDAMFASYADIYWQRNGADWQADFGNYYDRALAYYAMWQRTGRAEYAERGDAHVVNYRDVYLVPAAPPYGASAHWAQFRGLAIHAVRAGDEKSRTAVVRMAEVLAQVLPEYYTPGGGDLRILARMIEGSLLAWRLTKNGTALPPETWPRDWAAQIDKLLATAAAWEEDGSDPTRGLYPVAVSCWTTMNYQLALLLDALTAAHDLYRPDPAIVAQVRRAADWLWATQWKGTGFQYLSSSCPNVGGTEIASDLTGMFVGVWGWLARRTGDATYRAQGDAMFVAAVAGAYPQGGKQFNEMFSTSWRYLGRR